VNAYLNALARYFSFSGRSSRSQYWMFHLVALLIIIVAMEIDALRGDGFHFSRGDASHLTNPYGLATSIVILFHIAPAFALMIRRLHDIGKSGWWWLLGFIPFGGLVVFYWNCKASEPGTNDYGEDPHDTPPPEPEYVAPTGTARVPNLSRPAPVSSVQAIARTQAPTFGMRGRS